MTLNLNDNSDVFRLGGVRWVGRFLITGHDRPQQWNVQAAKGQKGASSTHDGEPIGTFDVTFFIADDPTSAVDEYAEWDKYQALIESTTSGRTPLALPVYNPDLARNRYTAVSNGGVGGMVRDGKGGASVKCKFIEYRPPQKKPSAKAQSKDSGKTGPAAKVDPNAAAKAELAALLVRAQAP